MRAAQPRRSSSWARDRASRRTGRAGPFVGASGQLLTELIASLGWQRPDVFITNVVKCRPPGNRDPQPDEIAACAPFLRRQLEVLDPSVVVTVGKHSLNAFRPGRTDRPGPRRPPRPPIPTTGAANALVFSMYHPAFALYQGSNRKTLFDDIAGLPGALVAARARREAAACVHGRRGFACPGAPAPTSVPPPAAPLPSPQLPSFRPAASDRRAPRRLPSRPCGQLTLF